MLARRLLQVQEEERQNLAASCTTRLARFSPDYSSRWNWASDWTRLACARRVQERRVRVRDLTAQVREMSLQLRPSMLDDLGLLPALLGTSARHRQVRRRRLPASGVRASYWRRDHRWRAAEERSTNVARHAVATAATVRIAEDALVQLHLEIEDQGVGFDPDAIRDPVRAAASPDYASASHSWVVSSSSLPSKVWAPA